MNSSEKTILQMWVVGTMHTLIELGALKLRLPIPKLDEFTREDYLSFYNSFPMPDYLVELAAESLLNRFFSEEEVETICRMLCAYKNDREAFLRRSLEALAVKG